MSRSDPFATAAGVWGLGGIDFARDSTQSMCTRSGAGAVAEASTVRTAGLSSGLVTPLRPAWILGFRTSGLPGLNLRWGGVARLCRASRADCSLVRGPEVRGGYQKSRSPSHRTGPAPLFLRTQVSRGGGSEQAGPGSPEVREALKRAAGRRDWKSGKGPELLRNHIDSLRFKLFPTASPPDLVQTSVCRTPREKTPAPAPSEALAER